MRAAPNCYSGAHMDPISFKPGAVIAGALLNPSAGAGGAASSGFGEALKKALEQVNASQVEGQRLAREFQLENPAVSLEETMIASQKASIGFQAAVQVRNKLVSAYQDIMNMPV